MWITAANDGWLHDGVVETSSTPYVSCKDRTIYIFFQKYCRLSVSTFFICSIYNHNLCPIKYFQIICWYLFEMTKKEEFCLFNADKYKSLIHRFNSTVGHSVLRPMISNGTSNICIRIQSSEHVWIWEANNFLVNHKLRAIWMDRTRHY